MQYHALAAIVAIAVLVIDPIRIVQTLNTLRRSLLFGDWHWGGDDQLLSELCCRFLRWLFGRGKSGLFCRLLRWLFGRGKSGLFCRLLRWLFGRGDGCLQISGLHISWHRIDSIRDGIVHVSGIVVISPIALRIFMGQLEFDITEALQNTTSSQTATRTVEQKEIRERDERAKTRTA
jgi:hypothetical protein